MVIIERDKMNYATLKVPWGKKIVQRGLLFNEIRPGVYAGFVTFHREITVGFVWKSQKYDLPWVSGRAQKCVALQEAIVAAIKQAA